MLKVSPVICMIELYDLYLAVDIDIGNVMNAMDKLIDILSFNVTFIL